MFLTTARTVWVIRQEFKEQIYSAHTYTERLAPVAAVKIFAISGKGEQGKSQIWVTKSQTEKLHKDLITNSLKSTKTF